MIHELNTKEIIAVKESLYICDKTHVDFHKTFASIFSAYTTSALKILSQRNDKMGISCFIRCYSTFFILYVREVGDLYNFILQSL